MRRPKDIIKFLLFLLFFIGNLNSIGLAASKTTLMVSATVIPMIKQSVIRQETRIQVTETDVIRGFVEIPSGTILQVKTNHKNGYFLSFEGMSELFKEIWVIDKGRTTVLPSTGGFVHQSYPGGDSDVKDLTYRIHLRGNVQPGLYSWPFRVSASLL